MVLFTYHSTGAKLGSMPETEVVQQLHLPVTEDPPKGGTLVQDDETGLLPSVTLPGEGPSTKSLLKPFILSEGLPPVSYKLTEKILCGEFVNMAELLQRRASTATHSTPASAPQSEGGARPTKLGPPFWHSYGHCVQQIPTPNERAPELSDPYHVGSLPVWQERIMVGIRFILSAAGSRKRGSRLVVVETIPVCHAIRGPGEP